MPFERFTKTGRVYTPKASIWTRGQIGFNQGAVHKFNLKDFDYAVLYYNRDEKKVGVQFTNDSSESGATKVIKGKTGVFLSGRSFINFYDIPHTKTKKYDVSYDNDSNMYIFEHE